ncbi:MAG: phage integrase N-terminal SAM-like domain-containing protein [Geminicoccaceae bacterium]
MIEDMTVRGFGAKTRHDDVRHVRTFAAFIGRSPATATAEEVRRFQLHPARSRLVDKTAARSYAWRRRALWTKFL